MKKVNHLYSVILLFAFVTLIMASDADNGKTLFNSFAKGKCKMCHNVTWANKVGPGLAGVKNRNAKGAAHHGKKLTPNILMDIIRDPKSVSPGAKMPANNKLTDKEIKDIVAYLKEL